MSVCEVNIIQHDKTKHVRTKIRNIFGIIPIPIYIMSFRCKANCIYCPTQQFIPKSYIINEDTLRARQLDYDAGDQIRYWIEQISKKHQSDKAQKLQIIILGGTFGDISKFSRITFFKSMYDALNGFESANLKDAVFLNKTAKYRACVVTIETRPDNITKDECEFLLSLGVSQVELGVQSIYDDILKKIGRPGNQETVKYALKLLKEYGFKVGIHLMINLPFSDIEKDSKMLDDVCNNPDLLADFIKIYPLSLVKDKSAQPIMWKLYKDGTWKPYKKSEILKIIYRFLVNAPEYINVQRIQRQFDDMDFFYGSFKLKAIVEEQLDKKSIELNDLRSQELKTYNSGINLSNLNGLTFSTIQYTNNDYLLTLKNEDSLLMGYARFYADKRCIIRQLKVLGECSFVGSLSNIQGKGIGKYLVEKAENLARDLGFKELFVISSPGVRGYFEQIGFVQSHYLMKKDL